MPPRRALRTRALLAAGALPLRGLRHRAFRRSPRATSPLNVAYLGDLQPLPHEGGTHRSQSACQSGAGVRGRSSKPRSRCTEHARAPLRNRHTWRALRAALSRAGALLLPLRARRTRLGRELHKGSQHSLIPLTTLHAESRPRRPLLLEPRVRPSAAATPTSARGALHSSRREADGQADEGARTNGKYTQTRGTARAAQRGGGLAGGHTSLLAVAWPTSLTPAAESARAQEPTGRRHSGAPPRMRHSPDPERPSLAARMPRPRHMRKELTAPDLRGCPSPPLPHTRWPLSSAPHGTWHRAPHPHRTRSARHTAPPSGEGGGLSTYRPPH